MPLNQTSGNVTTDAYGGGAAVQPNYIESVFSTYLYTGNGGSQTIANGIDLSTKGGLVWTKTRNAAVGHGLVDTVRGGNQLLQSNTTAGNDTYSGYITAFNTTGYTLGASGVLNDTYNMASWTFRKQPKFFDVVTYTGTGSPQTIAHNLGSTPGCMIVKKLSASSEWWVWHKDITVYGLPSQFCALTLNSTNPTDQYSTIWNETLPTSTTFTVGSAADINASGATFVAYFFAHNAGGFGLNGTDNVISCGSFTTDGNGTIPTTTLGYEPQWVIFKPTSTTGAWTINDTMRGQPTPTTANASAPDATLYANNANAESQADNLYPTATGFKGVYAAVVPSTTYIYIAIRRGPMKVPTDATKVFGTDTFGSTSPKPPDLHASFPVDFAFYRDKSSVYDWYAADRLRGAQGLSFNNTNAESAITAATFDYQNGWYNSSVVLSTYQSWMFRRAPSFFDEVCFTSANGTQAHNLGVAPELVIMKTRGAADSWYVFTAQNGYGILNNTNAWGGLGNGSGLGVNLANVTSTTLSAFSAFEGVGVTCVAYLFATCAGVSKVGSYTGNGSTQAIACGFTGGARFVLIKRFDATGSWYVYDTSRGMSVLTDPYLLLNSTAAESATLGSVTTTTGGFTVNASILSAINTNGASYIFLAIA